jgi:hypothetical protein
MLAIGSVWGSVRLKSIESEALTAPDTQGNPYLTGDYGPRTYVIECKCGRQKHIPVHEFPGKWNFRYCGEADCEFSPEAMKAKRKQQDKANRRPVGRPPSDDPSVNITVSMPLSVVTRVKIASTERGLSLGKGLAMLADKGLVWELEHADD